MFASSMTQIAVALQEEQSGLVLLFSATGGVLVYTITSPLFTVEVHSVVQLVAGL
jgi:hypothetical protein